MPKKITCIISNINKVLAFGRIADNLNKKKFILNFVLLNSENSVPEYFLRAKHIPVHRVLCPGKKELLGNFFFQTDGKK